MNADPLEHLLYRLGNVQIKHYPFPHIYIKNVFPQWFYDHLVEGLKAAVTFEQAVDYPNRMFSCALPTDAREMFASQKLSSFIRSMLRLEDELDVMLRWSRDVKGYSLGPHTDYSGKVATLLFYLPDSTNAGPWGTSIYAPKSSQKILADRHYYREDFNLVQTFPFAPNTMFGFLRTENSWHGVEPLTEDIQRDTLHYTILKHGASI